jgi:hypothetical protein
VPRLDHVRLAGADLLGGAVLAWVVGDEQVVGYEFDSKAAEEYAKGS